MNYICFAFCNSSAVYSSSFTIERIEFLFTYVSLYQYTRHSPPPSSWQGTVTWSRSWIVLFACFAMGECYILPRSVESIIVYYGNIRLGMTSSLFEESNPRGVLPVVRGHICDWLQYYEVWFTVTTCRGLGRRPTLRFQSVLHHNMVLSPSDLDSLCTAVL